MNTQNFSGGLLACTLFLSACAPATVDQLSNTGKTQLSRQQLEDGVAGKKVRLEAVDFDANVTFQVNGTLSGTQRDGTKDKGKWKVTNEALLCLKFEKWYFGDSRCYQVFNDQEDKLVLFTSNGARYYTATVSNFRVATEETTTSSRPKPKPSASQPVLTPEEKRERIVRLARDCPDCNFPGADLSKANLIGAKLAGATLAGADMSGSNLRRADLRGADLTGANLALANLPGADLTDCKLEGADLSGANLTRAIVHGADFTGAILEGAILNSVQGKIE